MTRPTLTVGLPNFGAYLPDGEWHRFVDVARAADDAGVDRIVLVDHVVMGEHTDAYSWGNFPTPPEAPWLEPLTMLAAIASATERVRLATGILIAPLRPAAFLAKQCATLDVLSRGRLDLGVGTGWQREEYEAVGIEFDKRGQQLTDTLAAMQALWRETPTTFESPTISFRDIYCMPKPAQPGGVPLWVAGTLNKRNLDRVVRFGSAWIPIMGETVEGITAGVQQIRDVGKDMTGFQVQGPLRYVRDDKKIDLARSMESVPELVAAGATDIHVTLQAFSRDPADAPRLCKDFVARFNDAI